MTSDAGATPMGSSQLDLDNEFDSSLTQHSAENQLLNIADRGRQRTTRMKKKQQHPFFAMLLALCAMPRFYLTNQNLFWSVCEHRRGSFVTADDRREVFLRYFFSLSVLPLL